MSIMAKPGIDKKPLVRLHPKVWTAMHVYANRPKDAPDQGKEKGFLLAGDVSEGGMVIDVTDVVIFPQKGNGTAVDFDPTHPKAGKFWPALHQWCQKSGKVVVGWAHYFSGGVHHSSHDDFTDDLLSQASRGTTPVFISMTWNDSKAGVEGKVWAKVGETDIQVTVDDFPLEFVYDNSVLDSFQAAMEREKKVSIKLGVQFDDVTFVVPASDLGLDMSELVKRAFDDLRNETAQYLSVKDGDLGQKLWRLIRTHGIDPATATAIEKQLNSLWKPDGVVQDFRGTPSLLTSGKVGATTKTDPIENAAADFVWSDSTGELSLVLTDDEATEWETHGIDWSEIPVDNLVIVDTANEKVAVKTAIVTDEWDNRTVFLHQDGLRQGRVFLNVQQQLGRQGYGSHKMGQHPVNQMTLKEIAAMTGQGR